MTPDMIIACETLAINAMAAEFPDVPVVVTGQAVDAKASLYVRFWVVPSEEVLPISLGSGADSRNVGLVQASVYGPKDKGAGETGAIAHFLRKLFHRNPVEVTDEGHVVFKDAGVRDMGDTEEEHMQVMRVPYRYDFKA